MTVAAGECRSAAAPATAASAAEATGSAGAARWRTLRPRAGSDRTLTRPTIAVVPLGVDARAGERGSHDARAQRSSDCARACYLWLNDTAARRAVLWPPRNVTPRPEPGCRALEADELKDGPVTGDGRNGAWRAVAAATSERRPSDRKGDGRRRAPERAKGTVSGPRGAMRGLRKQTAPCAARSGLPATSPSSECCGYPSREALRRSPTDLLPRNPRTLTRS